MISHFALLTAQTSEEYAFAGIFHSCVQIHNFTFDLVMREEPEPGSETVDACICMSATFPDFGTVGDSFISLHGFTSQRTIIFAKVTKNHVQFSLTSLRVTFNDPAAAVILLCLISGANLVLLMMHGKSAVADPCLVVLSAVSGLIGKSVTTGRNSVSLVYYAG